MCRGDECGCRTYGAGTVFVQRVAIDMALRSTPTAELLGTPEERRDKNKTAMWMICLSHLIAA